MCLHQKGQRIMFYSRSRLLAGLILVPLVVGLRMGGFLPNPRESSYVVVETPEEISERNTDFLFERGDERLNSDDYQGAIDDFTRVIERDPRNWSAYRNRAMIYVERHDFVHALADFDKAIELESKNSDLYLRRSDVHVALNQHKQAETDLSVAIALDPNNPIAYLGRGSVRQDLHDFERAIEDYTQAIHLNKKELLAFNNLAWLFATCPKPEFRKPAKAVEYALHICKESEWKKTTFFDTLAAAYAASGNFGEAVKWQEKALASSHSYDSPEEKQKGKARLKLYRRRMPYFEE
jgi:serine/threonine-protein kinase